MRFKGIIVIIFSFLVTITCSSSCKIDKSFNLRNESVSLQSSQSSLWSKPGVGSSAACASDCGRDDNCLAFFYNPQEDVCTAHSRLISLGHLTSGQAMYYSVDSWDCSDVLKLTPTARSGVYTVYPGGRDPVDVYCDMDTDGGGWTVFQRRQDGSEDFNQDWATYKSGFGNLNGEFWLGGQSNASLRCSGYVDVLTTELNFIYTQAATCSIRGNDNIHLLTTERNMQLRFDMRDKGDQSGFATYSTFRVDDESSNYKLTAVSGFAGDRGDSFSHHNGRMFSTKNRDNDIKPDGHCAAYHESGWWFGWCFTTNPNGLYGDDTGGMGISWTEWHGYHYSLMAITLKLRPI